MAERPESGGILRPWPVAPRSTTSAAGHSPSVLEASLTSNIAQSYPYSSETETDRVAVIDKALAQFDGLRDRKDFQRLLADLADEQEE